MMRLKRPMLTTTVVLLAGGLLGCNRAEVPKEYETIVPQQHRDSLRKVSWDGKGISVFYDDVAPEDLVAAYRSHLEADGYGDMLECSTPDRGLDLVKAPNHEVLVTTWPLGLVKVLHTESRNFSLPGGEDCKFTAHARQVCEKIDERSCKLKQP